MKPLSKKQREVLQKVVEGYTLYMDCGTPYILNGDDMLNAEQLHSGTFNSLFRGGTTPLIEPIKNEADRRNGVVKYKISPFGYEALAKPTRNRGKKKKPDLGDPQEKIMV